MGDEGARLGLTRRAIGVAWRGIERFGSAGCRGARNDELWFGVIYLTFSAPLFCEIAVDYAPGGVRCPVLDNATERQRRCRMPEF